MEKEQDKKEKTKRLAAKVLQLARDSIVIHMRFMDVALANIELVPKENLNCVYCDGAHIYYDPLLVLKEYREESAGIVHMYLHMLFHCIFHHQFQYGKMEGPDWDLAVDIAVENIILELELSSATVKKDRERLERLRILKKQSGALTAEKIYRNFRINPLSEDGRAELTRLFYVDEHSFWQQAEQLEVNEAQWKKISERIKTDLKTFSKEKNNSESLEENLKEATRQKQDYGAILRRFMVMGEERCLNEDEFDYVYYTYGLARYGNMPLIEPLEYKETKKVKEFVIVLDTSASCRGKIVQAFLEKTYGIFMEGENFFHKINIHIIQCDNEIQSDTKITCQEDFDRFLKTGKLKGFGGTDFRPAFSYVEELRTQGEFENLKGMIYFTDGFGIYPEKMPDYNSIFIFLGEDETRPQVPPWAIQAVLEEEELEKQDVEKKGDNQ